MERSNMEVVQGANSTINIISKKEDEVEDLIGLAEDVSTNIEKLSQKRLYVFVSSAFAFVLTPILAMVLFSYVIRLDINTQLNATMQVLLFATVIAVMFISIRSIYSAFQIKKKIELESNILDDLLNMIDGLKRNLSDDSLIRKAYFDMRLSRINFNHAKFKKQAQNTASVQQETTQSKPTESPVSTSV